MNDEQRLAKQLDREDASQDAGLDKFKKSEANNNKINNASSNTFGLSMIKARHEQVINNIEILTAQHLGSKSSERRQALECCTIQDMNNKSHELMKVDVWALIGFRTVIDNLFNPNRQTHTEMGKHGGDKRYIAKKDQSELELHIGKLINNQMSLELVKQTFPNWFRVHDKFAKRPFDGAVRSTPAYYNKRMVRAINKLAKKLEAKGDNVGAEFLRNRRPWTDTECRVIGELVVYAVLQANADYLKSSWKYVDGKKRYDIVLTGEGQLKAKELQDFVAAFAHEVLPMCIEPNIITNESLGGWFHELLQEPERSHKGEIILSDRHLEFINRQAQVQFEINPFTQQLLHRLMEENKPLGKFDYQMPDNKPSVSTHLGIAAVTDPSDRLQLIKQMSKEDKRQARRDTDKEHHETIKQSMHNVISKKLVNMTEIIAADDYFYIPMKYCFRGRIYSRVPFLSFQGTDVGKYLLRFHQKTPIDDRTEHWLKVGIANAAGQDKQCWDDRIKWFDKNKEMIINVGQMLSTGNFSSAYEFLSSNIVDDPFCLAALANEYVKIFIDKTQDYSQVFVLVDASCSGTSIFNAWRLNKQGAIKTNLVDTPQVNDIYMAVWHEIKRIAPPNAFRASHIKRLEKSKYLRKMMKTTYVPASYASPVGEQLSKLRSFNTEVLKPAGLAFKDDKKKPNTELKILQSLWSEALDNVSSIQTVVNWFKDRTREVLDDGAKEIICTSVNGSKMILRYPKSDLKTVTCIGGGDARSRRKALKVFKDEPFKKKLLSSVTANVTHMTDAAALCEALWNWDVPFVAVHDACGLAPSQKLDDGIKRLKRGLIDATRHNIWNTFRRDNNLPLDHITAGPVIGDLNLDDIMESNYMFS